MIFFPTPMEVNWVGVGWGNEGVQTICLARDNIVVCRANGNGGPGPGGWGRGGGMGGEGGEGGRGTV